MAASRRSKTKEQARKRKKRILFKISHHALGIFGPGDNPFFKKRSNGRSARLAHGSGTAAAANAKNIINMRTGRDAEAGGPQQTNLRERKDELEQEDVEREKEDQSQWRAKRVVQFSSPALSLASPSRTKPNSYLEKLQSRLSGGQFRMLNQKLYTSSGEESFKFFKEDPSAFKCYHAGYQEQMSRWPSQPFHAIMNWLKNHSDSLVVADFGCGSGKLAKSVRNHVYSLDLVASDETIIECNMACTPLKTQSVDVAVFCLSLMGTDYPSFLCEAHRVLKPRGTLLIAEVRSRFDPSNGGADPSHFIKALNTLGFTCMHQVGLFLNASYFCP